MTVLQASERDRLRHQAFAGTSHVLWVAQRDRLRHPAEASGLDRRTPFGESTKRVSTALMLLLGGLLLLASCDSAEPVLAPSEAKPPEITPSTLTFPETEVGSTRVDNVLIKNLNKSKLTVDVVRVDGRDRTAFSADISTLVVEAERANQVAVTFAPSRVGTHEAALLLFHSAKGSDPDTVLLTGDGFQNLPCTDADNDGYPGTCNEATDCRDDDPDINPDATELCDQVDNNCNRLIDEFVTTELYVDADNDGYGAGSLIEVEGCPVPTTGYAEVDGDCRDDVFAINPGAAEVCDGLDNNCNQQRDEGVTPNTYYYDGDNDGYGLTDTTTAACTPPPGYVAQDGDCRDDVFAINPGVAEVCDGEDNNCNQQRDEGLPVFTYYLDFDLDTFGTETTTTSDCAQPTGYVAVAGDCDDGRNDINPNMAEICTGGDDEDCDTFIDDLDPDCQAPPCVRQDDCGLNQNNMACPQIGMSGQVCKPLCRDPSDCGTEACRPLQGTCGLGYCDTAGSVAEGQICTTSAECATGICFAGQCTRLCQTQADCSGNDVCGIALYDKAEFGGTPGNRQTTVCQPVGGRQPLGGGNCHIDASNIDTGLCATTHCDFLPWNSQTPPGSTALCANLCAGAGDCAPGQVCGLVYHGFAESPPILSTGEGSGRYFEGVLGCYTPIFFDGISWTPYAPGTGDLGSPCSSSSPQGSMVCRSHQCAQFAPILNQCTDFCDEDSDCVTPSTPNWVCRVGELSLTGIFLQSAGVADITKFTMIGVCAP